MSLLSDIIIFSPLDNILKGDDRMNEKLQTSVSWEAFWRKRLKKLANILSTTESQLSQDAFEYYVKNSNLVKKALHKIAEQDQFIKELKPQKITEVRNGIEYRPYIAHIYVSRPGFWVPA